MLEEKGDREGLAKLPHVTCFERSSQPGGLWRAADADKNQEITTSSGSDVDTDEETDSDDEVFAEFMEDDHAMMKKT